MKKIILISLLLLFAFGQKSFSQNDTLKLKGAIYSFVPQYLINHGIRIDYERQISPRSLIQFCPQFYLGEKKSNRTDDPYYSESSSNDDFNNISGFGLNIYHKVFANQNFLKRGIYFSYGISYSYFDIDYYEEYLGETISTSAYINKYGADLLLGYQFFFRNKLSLDIYTGVGTRISTMTGTGTDKDRFSSTYFGYNYDGNLLHGGVRIGLIL